MTFAEISWLMTFCEQVATQAVLQFSDGHAALEQLLLERIVGDVLLASAKAASTSVCGISSFCALALADRIC